MDQTIGLWPTQDCTWWWW